MTDAPGWPARSGVPLNPERDGWHWLVPSINHALPPGAYRWHAPPRPDVIGQWDAGYPQDVVRRGYDYLGPCLTPNEHASALAAQAEEAMDTGATKAIEILARALGVKQWEGGDGTETWDGDVSVEIGNVLKAAGVYEDENGTVATHAALAAQAVAMREACAAIVDAHAAAAKRCSEEGDVIYRIRAEFLANSYAITQAADDVRVTPLPHADALAAQLAAERAAGVREGMEKAAGIAGATAWRCPNAGCTSIAAAITAAMKEAQG